MNILKNNKLLIVNLLFYFLPLTAICQNRFPTNFNEDSLINSLGNKSKWNGKTVAIEGIITHIDNQNNKPYLTLKIDGDKENIIYTGLLWKESQLEINKSDTI